MPHALLIAREDSLGILRPAAATMETTIGVILFPGSPPKLWKSKTLSDPKEILSPDSAMALAYAAISSVSIPLMYSAVSQAEASILESLPATTSATSCEIFSGSRRFPSIFSRMYLTDSGLWDTATSAIPPTATPARSCTEGGTSTVPGETRVSETDTIAMAADPPEILTRSPSATPRTRQSSSCISTVGSDVSRS